MRASDWLGVDPVMLCEVNKYVGTRCEVYYRPKKNFFTVCIGIVIESDSIRIRNVCKSTFSVAPLVLQEYVVMTPFTIRIC